MKMRDISAKWKLLIIALLGPLLLAAILSWQRIDNIKTSAIENIVDKSKTIVLMAEATRNQMARKLQLGLIKPFGELDPANVVEAVPVVTAMQTAAVNAEAAGYVFRAPKVSPRNPKNTPTAEELEYLNRLREGNLAELVIVKDNEVRYLKPIKLTEDCMFCHGDPAGKKDPIGGTKEGWKTGEMHGAFEIISSLDGTNATIRKAAMNVVLLTIAILAAITVAVWFLAQQSIVKPLKQASAYIKTIAAGNLTAQLGWEGNDEIGMMVKDLARMAGQLRQMISSILSSSATLREESAQLTKGSSTILDSTRNLNGRSNSVAAAAEEMSSNMNTVAAATEEAATNIAMVSQSTEDMASTIREIAANTAQTQEITAKAVSRSESASHRVDQLGEAATRIGKVTETITEISGQTNLLALNATIEAARAGEAGKGFAVVANEIKELARQTADATMEIKSHIEGIQDQTKSTVTEIQEISRVIREINEIVVIVAAAVEEQNVTTSEIAENITQATLGIQEVTENVSQSSIVADEVARDISQVNHESNDIAQLSSNLNDQTERLNRLSNELDSLMKVFIV